MKAGGIPLSQKKVKKVEIFRPKPLTTAAESSIIGLTLERERGNAKTSETEVRETAGKIEGIGDVLSDGSKRILGKSMNTNVMK